MRPSLLLSLRPGASYVDEPEAFVAVDGRPVMRLAGVSETTRAALRALGGTGADEATLTDRALAAAGPVALAELHFCLDRLAELGLVSRSAHLDGVRLATFESSTEGAGLSFQADLDGEWRLSRFAHVRRQDGDLVLDSPLSPGRVVVHDPRVLGVLHALAGPISAAEVRGRAASAGTELGGPAVDRLLLLLAGAGMISPVGAGGSQAEDDGGLRFWEFHDLVFHAESRTGRPDRLLGATFRFAGQVDPPPACRPVSGHGGIPLHVPDLDALARHDRPFTSVHESRSSVRSYDSTPIALEQLGEFLYRVARVTSRERRQIDGPAGPYMFEVARRPYPGGGALYELELYLAVRRCRGVAAGGYYYDPVGHRLLPQPQARTADLDRLWERAGWATGIAPEDVQVLFVVAARFPRVAWKYSAIAYSVVLKDVGALYQSMYLVATAMDLAPCAVGSGDWQVFARAFGRPSDEETSVGEFLLGSRPPNR